MIPQFLQAQGWTDQDIAESYYPHFQITPSKSAYFASFLSHIPHPSGYKLHLSAHLHQYQSVMQAALPVLQRFQQSFKIVRSRWKLLQLNLGQGDPRQAGKFITIYPDESVVWEMAEALHQASASFEAPYIITDKQYATSRVVYYRYGAFTKNTPILVSGHSQEDTRDIHHPIPAGIEDPFQLVERAYQPLNTLYDDFAVIEHSVAGFTLQSPDGRTLLREGRILAGMDLNGQDAADRLLRSVENESKGAFVLKVTDWQLREDTRIATYQTPETLRSLQQLLLLKPSFDIRRAMFESIRPFLLTLHEQSLFWGYCTPGSLWLNPALEVFISHTELLTHQDLDAPSLFIHENYCPNLYLYETQLPLLLSSTWTRIFLFFHLLFEAELKLLPIPLKQAEAVLLANVDQRPVEREQVLDFVNASLESFVTLKNPLKQKDTYSLRLMKDYTSLSPLGEFYLINVSATPDTAATIQNRVLDLMEEFCTPHIAIMSRKNPLELSDVLQNRYFKEPDFGVLISICFDDFEPFEQFLHLLTGELAGSSYPILPYFHSTYLAPIVHFGKARVSADDGKLMQLDLDAPLQGLQQFFSSHAENQNLDAYELVEPIHVRARGSVYRVKNRHDNQVYLLKECRKGYEPDAHGQDAAYRAMLERQNIIALQAFAFVNRYQDSWETNFAMFLVKDEVAGTPLDILLKQGRPLDYLPVYATALLQLKALHDAHWVWLDCKPANIIVSPVSDQVYFIDLESAFCLDKPFELLLTWITKKYRPSFAKSYTDGASLMGYDYYAWLISLLESMAYDQLGGIENNVRLTMEQIRQIGEDVPAAQPVVSLLMEVLEAGSFQNFGSPDVFYGRCLSLIQQ